MKKALLFLILTITLITCFVSCDKNEHVHEFDEWFVTKNATCTEEGTKVRYCDCGEKQSDVIPTTEHVEEIIPAKEATCTNTGLTEGKKCSSCGEILVDPKVVDKKAHTDETILAVESTCTEKGLTEGKKCSVCDEILVVQQEAPLKAHIEVIDNAVASTCTKTGLTKGKHCSVCGTVLVAQQEIPVAAHTYDDKYDESCNECGNIRDAECAHIETEVIPGNPSSCIATGLTDGTKCKKCDEILVVQQEIPISAHTEESIPAVDATCTETGLTSGTKCSVCGRTLIAQQETPIVAHTYDDKYDETCNKCGCIRDAKCAHNETEKINGYVATCIATGLTDGSKCKKCGEIIVVQTAIPVSAHTEAIDNAVESTCTSTGLTEGKHCSVCSKVLVAQNVTNMKPHTEVIDNAVESTCTATGLTEGKHCSVCSKVIVAQTFVPMKSHFTVTDQALAATCTQTGLTEGTHCKNCETVFIAQVEIPILDCIESDWVVAVEATKTANGTLKKMCIMCEKTLSEVVMGAGSQELSFALNVDNKSYSVVGRGTCIDEDIVIPSVYFGLPVTTITNYAFRSFSDYNAIKSITIPNSVTWIGEDAFDLSKPIEAVYYTGDIIDWLGINFNGYYSNPLNTGAKFHLNGELVTKLDIPNTVTSIPNYAFCGSSVKEINIPGSVMSIGEYAFSNCKSLTSITIPDSVKSIGGGAFHSCDSLVSVIIGKSVESIESYAFDSCNSLIEICNKSSLNIIAGYPTYGNIAYYAKHIITEENQSYLKYVGDYIFYDDKTDIYLVKYIGSDVEITLPDYNSGKEYEIYQYAFYDNNCVTSITIPNYVTGIGCSSLYNCIALTNILIPDSVISIGDYAFASCTALTNIHIPDGMISINDYAFASCTALTNIIIPDSVINIGAAAFSNCTSLKYNEYDNAYYLGNDENPYCVLIEAKDTNITSCEIHSDTKVIASSAFSYCSKLKNTIIPNSVTNIGSSIFAGCSSLESLTLPFVGDFTNTDMTFGYLFESDRYGIVNKYKDFTCVFQYSDYYYYIPKSLKMVTITGGTIPKFAFKGCTMLECVTLGDAVTSIGYYAFDECSSLQNLKIGNSVEFIDSYAFNGCPLSYNEYNGVYYLGNDENPYLVLIKAKDKTITSLVIPDNTKFVYDFAFHNCTALVSVTIGSSVEDIGLYAFYDCYSLTSLTIGDSIKYISSYAFYRCHSLIEVYNKSSLNIYAGSEDYGYVGYYAENVITEESQSYIKYVGDYIFYDDGTDVYLVKYFGSDAEITLPEYDSGKKYKIYKQAFSNNDYVTSIVIPNCVTYIGYESFKDCTALIRLIIPISVTGITGYAFDGCTSLTIYCEADSKPNSWYNNSWNCGRPVVWGYSEN